MSSPSLVIYLTLLSLPVSYPTLPTSLAAYSHYPYLLPSPGSHPTTIVTIGLSTLPSSITTTGGIPFYSLFSPFRPHLYSILGPSPCCDLSLILGCHLLHAVCTMLLCNLTDSGNVAVSPELTLI